MEHIMSFETEGKSDTIGIVKLEDRDHISEDFVIVDLNLLQEFMDNIKPLISESKWNTKDVKIRIGRSPFRSAGTLLIQTEKREKRGETYIIAGLDDRVFGEIQ
jgi:hypothetical protein